MERESYEEDSDSSDASSFIYSRSCSTDSKYSSLSASTFAAASVGHLEIFRNEPEMVRFVWFREEDHSMDTRECSLDDLGLDPFICGYLERHKAGTAVRTRSAVCSAFFSTLKEICHAEISVIDNGRVISIQDLNKFSKCLSVTEVEKWILEVAKLFKHVDTVKKFKVSFPEMHDNIGIVKTKLNHHLKDKNVVAYESFDNKRETEILFVCEVDTSDFLEKLVDDIHKQEIITKSKQFEEQQVQILKVRIKWWKSILVNIKIQHTTVHATGLQEDVNEVFLKIHKILLSTVSNSFTLDEDEAEIFQSSFGKEFVKMQIKRFPVRPHWLINGNEIRIIGNNKDTVETCAKCIRECVKSGTISEIPDAILSSEAWKLQLEHLNNIYKNKLIIKSFDGTTKVTSTSDIYEMVSNDIKIFLKRHIILSTTIKSDKQKLDFFERRCRAEKENNFFDEFFQITRLSVGEVRVVGIGQSIAKAQKIIDGIVIVKSLAWVARQDVIGFLRSEEGRILLKEVEEENVCLIQTCAPRIHIRQTDAKLEEQRVDVIVNSAAPSLSMDMGQVAKCLYRKAGAILQQDIRRQYPKGVSEGKIVKGQPGMLQCKSVYHAVLPMNSTGAEATRAVRKLMEDCLAMAVSDKYESIAFPVFGTGTLTYSVEEVANTMYDVVTNFALTNVEVANTVKEITIVLFPGNSKVIKAFGDVKKKRSKRMDDCKANTIKLLMNPGCLLEFYVSFTSDSEVNNEKAMRQLEERLP
ncbi:hypothetical protein CHS0354_014388 [Potamilus streckersoni]|uniref:Macro domain-containing protein n=1 Tax=Potamilus streckersoni TaxID=2493646 RepID=A0AAE0SAL0_9BIVA|nr:hypothetical protein CHS0354_014388 [Potamilus streckersoni]